MNVDLLVTSVSLQPVIVNRYMAILINCETLSLHLRQVLREITTRNPSTPQPIAEHKHEWLTLVGELIKMQPQVEHQCINYSAK